MTVRLYRVVTSASTEMSCAPNFNINAASAGVLYIFDNTKFVILNTEFILFNTESISFCVGLFNRRDESKWICAGPPQMGHFHEM